MLEQGGGRKERLFVDIRRVDSRVFMLARDIGVNIFFFLILASESEREIVGGESPRWYQRRWGGKVGL